MITMLHYMYMITITPSDLEQLSPSSPLLAAEVFLLCFSISDHASLYTALDHWLPLLKVTLLMLLLLMMILMMMMMLVCFIITTIIAILRTCAQPLLQSLSAASQTCAPPAGFRWCRQRCHHYCVIVIIS